MARNCAAPISRIPGGGMPLAAQEKHTKDVTKLTRIELLEIKDRESKLLRNKGFINRLPDKGKRMQEFHDKVVAELKRRANIEDAAAMFSDLNIAEKGEKFINRLEWQGHLDNDDLLDADPTDDVLDSDDELEADPLRVVAKAQMHERRVKVLPPVKTLITQTDIEEIKSFQSSNENGVQEIEPHVIHLVEKTELNVKPLREKYKPYQTTTSNVHDPAKEIHRKRNEHWEVTAATPPPLKSCGVKQISLLDSVALQTKHVAHLKQLHEQQAEERLKAKMDRLAKRNIELPSIDELRTKASFTTYRNTNEIEGSRLETNEYVEVHDDLDEAKGRAAVSYTIENS